MSYVSIANTNLSLGSLVQSLKTHSGSTDRAMSSLRRSGLVRTASSGPVRASDFRNRSVYSPVSTNMALWVDFGDTASLTLDSGKVSQANDKSGKAQHMAQTTAANRPTYSSNSHVTLTGGNAAWLRGTLSSLDLRYALTTFVVSDVTGGGMLDKKGVDSVSDGGSTGDKGYLFHTFPMATSSAYTVSNGRSFGMGGYANGYFQSTAAITTGKHVVSMLYDGASWFIVYDGGYVATSDYQGTIEPWRPSSDASKSFVFLGAGFTGRIHEVAIVAGPRSLNQCVLQHMYFLFKHGLSKIFTTSGLFAAYTAESWTGSQWTDMSGNERHAATSKGTVAVTFDATTGRHYLSGGTSAGILFPSGVLPSTYTLFHITKYNGAAKGRIVAGTTSNWLSGFHGGKSGVAFHNNGWLTAETDRHGSNWVLSTDQITMYRSNKVDRTSGGASGFHDSQIGINYLDVGSQQFNEYSDWACSCVLVYNRALTLAEYTAIENELTFTYGLST
jgi:hypothetical protein